jgi:O-antigen/teichoic acid export membrane protein
MNEGGPATPSEPMGGLALGRRSLTYALGGLAYKGVAIVAVPILARLLSPAELGLLDLAAVIATIVGLSVALGSDQAVAYLEPRLGADGRVWASALALVLTATSILFVASVWLGDWIVPLLTGGSRQGAILMAAVAYGFVLALTSTALNAIRLHGSPRTYAVASFVIVTAEMAAALAVALIFESPVVLMVLAWALGALLVVGPLLIRYIPVMGKPNVQTMRRLVVFGAPLVPAAVVWLIGDAWIRTMLANEFDLHTIGEYGIAYRIASVIALVVSGFGVAWQPYIFRSPPGEIRARATGVLVYLTVALGVTGVALTALSPEVIFVVAGAEYARAADAVVGLSAGAVAMGVFVLISAVIGASGTTRFIAPAAALGLAVQLVAAPVLVPWLGLTGAGLASLSGYLVATAALVTHARRLLGRRAVVLVVAASCATGLGFLVAASGQEWPLAGRFAVVVLAILAGGVTLIAVRRTSLAP